MSFDLPRAFASEWLKRKRSLATWLVTAGALFTPAIITVARLMRASRLAPLYADADFWHILWKSAWESMAVFFLPMAAILLVSLITQIEYRGNAWKLVRTLPLSATTLYIAKFLVILVLLAQFILLFNFGVYLSAVIPCLLFWGPHYPSAHFPLQAMLMDDLHFFLDCLPILAAQYLLSLRFKSFLVPIGVGFLGWVAALAALPSRFGFAVPYIYTVLDYLRDSGTAKARIPGFSLYPLAAAYFVTFTIAGLWVFITKPEKG